MGLNGMEQECDGIRIERGTGRSAPGGCVAPLEGFEVPHAHYAPL